MTNFVGNILTSHKFQFYSKLVVSTIAGGSFVLFLMKNQVDYYKDQNADLQTKYKLSIEVSEKKCEDEKTLLKVNIENSMLQQYKKFNKDSKESKLFLETIDLLNEKSGK